MKPIHAIIIIIFKKYLFNNNICQHATLLSFYLNLSSYYVKPHNGYLPPHMANLLSSSHVLVILTSPVQCMMLGKLHTNERRKMQGEEREKEARRKHKTKRKSTGSVAKLYQCSSALLCTHRSET